MKWTKTTLGGWGRLPRFACEAARPERLPELNGAFDGLGEGTLIAHGAGRSYGDCALNENGRVLVMNRFDRILGFDPVSGDLEVEAGVSLRALMDVFLPRGFLVPVNPGTAFATVGGAIANDVHGKNHEKDGAFGSCLRWIDLLLPSGETVRVSGDSDRALFEATQGGVGLTGIMVAVGLRLTRVPSNALDVRETKAANLDALLAAIVAEGARARYSVAWIDALASGPELGRGILETAVESPVGLPSGPRRDKALPIDLPGFALNPLSVKAFNALWWSRVPAAGRSRKRRYDSFLFPLDAIHDWNRMYGRRGFRQFQCVVPRADGERALRQLLERVSASRAGSFLAVLKGMGAAGPGPLSFPMPGYLLALDFPERAGTLDLLADMERITRNHGGRIYLAKDSCLSADGFRAMYPRLDEFRAVVERVDPHRRLGSSLSRRLDIRGGGKP